MASFSISFLMILLLDNCTCYTYSSYTYSSFNFYYYIVIFGLFVVNVIATIVLICNGYIPKDLQCTAIILLFFLPYFSTLVIICIRRSRLAQENMNVNSIVVVHHQSNNNQPSHAAPINNQPHNSAPYNNQPPYIPNNNQGYSNINHNPASYVVVDNNNQGYINSNLNPPYADPYINNQGYSNYNQNANVNQNDNQGIQVNPNQQINYNNPYYQNSMNMPPPASAQQKVELFPVESNFNPPGPIYN